MSTTLRGYAAGEGSDYLPEPSELPTGRLWVDGRPIYQKSVLWNASRTNVYSTWASGSQLAHLTANIAAIVKLEGMLARGTPPASPRSRSRVTTTWPGWSRR